MRLRDNELRGLPVFSRDGSRIGKLKALVIDSESHTVAQYVVAKSRSLSALLPQELLVHPTQVISLDDEKMVVKDEFIAVEAAEAVALRGAEAAVPSASQSVRS
ncbi:MAG: PRC-barrel domain-containing protein [Patescibacteria group bacterium]|jgi:sporulation protein YlmC with PRC-barrel domain